SHSSSPLIHDPSQDDTVVSVSTAFFPGAHSMGSDLCFSSSDMVLFYVNSQVILAASEKAFSSLLSDTLSNEKYRNTVINVPEESVVLNVILHALYNLSCAQHSPALQTLLTAVNQMPFYDICVRKHVSPGTPLYQLLLSQAPLYPIDIYSLAAQHCLEDLAVNTSSHLLSYSLSSITDEMAQRMGAIYLKRLMFLHLGRNTALKNILLIPPPPHPPTKECNFTDQKNLTRAWALVSAYLAWDGRPDLSTSGMQRALSPLTDQLICNQCHQTLHKRIQDVVVQWTSVKVRVLRPMSIILSPVFRERFKRRLLFSLWTLEIRYPGGFQYTRYGSQ
ncbi:hypothetical protein M378DRAFT_84807, partial [Amanita muscaria Koide BX008]